MPNVHATISLIIKTDVLPPDIPGEQGPDGEWEIPISGAEQVSYDVFKRVQEILPEHVYGFIESVAVTE